MIWSQNDDVTIKLHNGCKQTSELKKSSRRWRDQFQRIWPSQKSLFSCAKWSEGSAVDSHCVPGQKNILDFHHWYFHTTINLKYTYDHGSRIPQINIVHKWTTPTHMFVTQAQIISQEEHAEWNAIYMSVVCCDSMWCDVFFVHLPVFLSWWYVWIRCSVRRCQNHNTKWTLRNCGHWKMP